MDADVDKKSKNMSFPIGDCGYAELPIMAVTT